MQQDTKHPNPHLHDADTGTKHGVPAGAAAEESKGVPDSGRHQTETAANASEIPDKQNKQS